MLINHVVSSSIRSGIFSAIFGYFERYAPTSARVEVSARPRADADIVHYHRPQLERSLRAPALVTVHHDLQDTNPALQLSRFLPRYREAARVICLNRTQAQILERAAIHHLTTIPHGFNEDVFRLRDPHTFAAPKVRLGFFSKRYSTRFKGEAYLQELAKRLSPRRFEFCLVGEGRADTASFLRQLGFEVRLYEYLPYALFQSLYESIDYLVMCSNFEGGPANLPEAIATGTPVLATAVGFAPELVSDGVNGLLLTGDIHHDIERVLPLADKDAASSLRLRAGARELVTRAPSWRVVVARHFALYEAVLAGGLRHG